MPPGRALPQCQRHPRAVVHTRSCFLEVDALGIAWCLALRVRLQELEAARNLLQVDQNLHRKSGVVLHLNILSGHRQIGTCHTVECTGLRMWLTSQLKVENHMHKHLGDDDADASTAFVSLPGYVHLWKKESKRNANLQ